MFSYIFPITGFCIMAVFFVSAVRRRHNTSQFISFITLGIFISTFFMLLPTQWVKSNSITNEPLYTALSSLLYSFKALGGRQDIAQLESIALSGIPRHIYIILNYISFVLAPVMASGLILSFYGDTGEKLRLIFKPSSNYHIFSELNENSLCLAKGITTAADRKTIVFCNTKNADKELIEKARKISVLLYKPLESFAIRASKKYNFYLISEDEDKNITCAVSLIQKYGDSNFNITVNAFATSRTGIDTVESLNNGRLRLRFIDEIALFCNNLLFAHPLYKSATVQDNGRYLISALIIGCGRTGTQMLKSIITNGRMTNCDLKIRILDSKAERIRSSFFADCPEINSPEYNIEFINSDITDENFESLITASSDSTYVLIATGDDALNITTADTVHRVLKTATGNYGENAPIYTRVRSGIMAQTLEKSENCYLKSRNISIFGNIESIYSNTTIFNNTLDRLALAVNMIYNEFTSLDHNDAQFSEIKRSFETNEYDRRNSTATALHIIYKLFCCGILSKERSALNISDADSFEEVLPQYRDMLAQNEHLRWNDYMRCDGYRAADFDTVKKYAEFTGSHKNITAKLHPCITNWENLDKLAQQYNAFAGTDKNFKKSDYDIIDNLGNIIRFALKTDN